MDEYAGYALVLDVCERTGMSQSALTQLVGPVKIKVGGYLSVRIDTLPEKYRPDTWYDLGEYLPSSAFNDMLGTVSSFTSLRIKHKEHPLPHIVIGSRTTLVPTTKEFRDMASSGMIPFLLHGKKEYAEVITTMHGIEIGWY